MAVKVELELGGAGVLFTYSDVLKGEEAVTASTEIYMPEILENLRYQIADLSDVNRIEVTAEQIRQLAEADKKAAQYRHGFLIASVVNHDLQGGLSRFYRTYAQDPHIETAIFKTISEARQWLRKTLASRGFELSLDKKEDAPTEKIVDAPV